MGALVIFFETIDEIINNLELFLKKISRQFIRFTLEKKFII